MLNSRGKNASANVGFLPMPEVVINGPAGRLEARYTAAKEENAPIALLLHPHPQHGGTMNNKVVYTLFHAFLHCGFSALRFNFRGVGRSQGNSTAARASLPMPPRRSTGCRATTQRQGVLDRRLLLRRLDRHAASDAPAGDRRFHLGGTASRHVRFQLPRALPASGLIVQGDQDQVVPLEAMQKLIAKLKHQRDITIDHRVVKGADHFFYNHLTELDQIVEDYIAHAKPKPMTAEL